MDFKTSEIRARYNHLKPTVITAVIFALPSVFGGFSWFLALIPVPVFYFLTLLGPQKGTTVVTRAAVLASIVAFTAGTLNLLLYSFTLLPLGFVMAQAAKRKDPVIRTAYQVLLVQCIVWLGFWLVYAAINQTNPYTDVLHTLDTGLEAAYNHYLQAQEIQDVSSQELKLIFENVRKLIPRIFPGLLAISTLCIVWFNLAFGNFLLQKLNPELTPWPAYRFWRLPEPLVWFFIAAVLLIFIPVGSANFLGINILLVIGLLYFFQGLAVLSCLMDRWSVPSAMRLFIYLFLFIQAYGFILLSILGLADVWLDLGKRQKNT